MFDGIMQRSNEALREEEEQRRKFEAARKQEEEEARKRVEDRQRREREEREAERDRMRKRAHRARKSGAQDSQEGKVSPLHAVDAALYPPMVFNSLRHGRFNFGTLTFLVHAIVKCVSILEHLEPVALRWFPKTRFIGNP